MFTVVKIELTDDGATYRHIKYRSKTLHECWNYVFNQALHPNKTIRDTAKELFVFDPLDKMVPYVPRFLKQVL